MRKVLRDAAATRPKLPRGNRTQAAAQLVITLFPTGQVQVTGPIQNKPLCERMLNGAAKAITEYRPPAHQGVRETPSGLVIVGE